ncbi:hypothetical protein IMSAG025_00463 [Muribaculaceae bacterium]|nr:hypothetical protein IMSAG025_00463 [Muribaculaceae bacterium]
MRIQGYVHHRFLRFGGLRHPHLEVFKSAVDVDGAAAVIVDFISGKHLALLLVDFLAVIYQTPVKRISY